MSDNPFIHIPRSTEIGKFIFRYYYTYITTNKKNEMHRIALNFITFYFIRN